MVKAMRPRPSDIVKERTGDYKPNVSTATLSDPFSYLFDNAAVFDNTAIRSFFDENPKTFPFSRNR
jgi:hypothetical protein